MFFGGGWPPPGYPTGQFELNRKSPQAYGLEAWFPGQACGNSPVLRDLTGNGHDADKSSNNYWLNNPEMGYGATGTTSNSDWVLRRTITNTQYEPWSITFWGIVTAWLGEYAPVFGNRNSSGNFACIYWDTYGTRLRVRIDTSAGTDVNVTIALDTLYHIAICHTGTEYSVFINGVYQTTSGSSDGVYTWRVIGGAGDNSFQWIGSIFDARFYNRILSASDVWQQYDPATRWELYRPVAPVWIVANITASSQTVSLNTLDLSLSAESSSLTTGAVAAVLATLDLILSAESLNLTAGAVSTPLDTLNLSLSAEALSLLPGAVSLSLDTLNLALSVEDLTLLTGAVSVSLDTINLALSVQDLNVSLGGLVLEVVFKGMYRGMFKGMQL